jgi:hypothetical protein
MEKAMFAKKMASAKQSGGFSGIGGAPPTVTPTTPMLKIPRANNSGLAVAGSGSARVRDDDLVEEEELTSEQRSEEERKYAPCSPTDNLLSPASKHIYRKRPLSRKLSKFFVLSHEVWFRGFLIENYRL